MQSLRTTSGHSDAPAARQPRGRRPSLHVSRGVALALVALVVTTTGCSQTVNVRTQSPQAELILDGEEVGELDPRGTNLEIGIGANPIPYTIIDNGRKFEGEILRTETSWPLLVAGVGLAVCAAPPCAVTACFIANPTVFPALALGTLAGAGLGGFIASISSPSWVTLPCFAAAGAIGLSPLMLLSISQRAPDAVVLGPSRDDDLGSDDADKSGGTFEVKDSGEGDEGEGGSNDSGGKSPYTNEGDDYGTDAVAPDDETETDASPYDDGMGQTAQQRDELEAIETAEVMAW